MDLEEQVVDTVRADAADSETRHLQLAGIDDEAENDQPTPTKWIRSPDLYESAVR